MDRRQRIAGCLLGQAAGDALGLPYENVSARRVGRLLGDKPLGYRLVGQRGLVSDDTEHACMVGIALLESGGEPLEFARALASQCRRWFLALPAGLGLGTMRAMIRLCVGFSPENSGVRTAGNGPAMRAPLLGVCLAGDPRLRACVRASTRLTHTDPRAEEGAWAIALAAQRAAQGGRLEPALLEEIRGEVQGEGLSGALAAAAEALEKGASAAEYAAGQGWTRGVSGYIDHTVPAALYCCLRHPDDLEAAIEAAIRLGGDTDSVAAIVGGVLGGALGEGAIPARWRGGLVEWPRTIRWMEDLAARLAARFPGDGAGAPVAAPSGLWLLSVPRNLAFLAIVVAHALRRVLPPY